MVQPMNVVSDLIEMTYCLLASPPILFFISAIYLHNY